MRLNVLSAVSCVMLTYILGVGGAGTAAAAHAEKPHVPLFVDTGWLFLAACISICFATAFL
jgi:hypothetical protein